MTETKAAGPTIQELSEELSKWAGHFPKEGREWLRSIADRLLSLSRDVKRLEDILNSSCAAPLINGVCPTSVNLSREVETKNAEIARLTARCTEIAPCNPGEDGDTIARRAVTVHNATVAACDELRAQRDALASRCEALTELVRDFHDWGKHRRYEEPYWPDSLLKSAESLLSTTNDK